MPDYEVAAAVVQSAVANTAVAAEAGLVVEDGFRVSRPGVEGPGSVLANSEVDLALGMVDSAMRQQVGPVATRVFAVAARDCTIGVMEVVVVVRAAK